MAQTLACRHSCEAVTSVTSTSTLMRAHVEAMLAGVDLR
jgi:hypothetical protein